jgi:hypothetical protein
MSDQDAPAMQTGVPRVDTGNGATEDEAPDRPENRPEDTVDVDVDYDDIESDPTDDDANVPDPNVGF